MPSPMPPASMMNTLSTLMPRSFRRGLRIMASWRAHWLHLLPSPRCRLAPCASALLKFQQNAPGTNITVFDLTHARDTRLNLYERSSFPNGDKKYKIVAMDSVLNGDLSTTTILMVGDEVGGAAGYDSAFQLTPTNEYQSISKIRFLHNGVEVSLRSFEGKTTKKLLRFDSKSNTLIEKIVR